MAGISFDRVAAAYDESRGGERRGRAVAEAIAPSLAPGRVVEVGLGTGVVALGLRGMGRDVVGVDLAPEMLRRAVDRIGERVAVADGERLPFPDGVTDNAVFVWVLQLVPDIPALLAEAARVVRPGGRVVVVPSTSIRDDEAWRIIQRMHDGFGLHRPGADAAGVEEAAQQVPELRHLSSDLAFREPYDLTPSREAQFIEERRFSSMFGLDDEIFHRHADPAVAALRAMAHADRPRPVESHQHVVVFDRAT